MRRYAVRGLTAALYGLWLCGICGLPMPTWLDPRTAPFAYAAAQLLLCIPIFAVGAGHAGRGAARLRGRAAWLFALALSAVAASALAVLQVLRAIGSGDPSAASRAAVALPLAPTCAMLTLTGEGARQGDCPIIDPLPTCLRFFLLCMTAVAGGAFAAELLVGADATASLHAALLFFTVGTPSPLFLMPELLAHAANKRTALRLSFADWARLGGATLLCADETMLWREDSAALDDIYVASGSKTALLATAAALARAADAPRADLLDRAADRLYLRRPHAADVRRMASGFCGTVHRRTWRFSTDSAGVPTLIRRADLGGRQALFAFCNDSFRGILLFACPMHADATAATVFLRDCGVRMTAARTAALPFSQIENEKVLHAAREGATIKLSDAHGATFACGGTPRALALAVQSGQCVTAAARAAICIFATVAFLSVPLAIGALAPRRAPLLLAAATMRQASLVAVCLLARGVRHANPPEFENEEELPAMFGKVNYTIRVEGMSCSHCAAHVKTALESIRGVSANVVLEEKVAHVKCPASLDAQKLSAAVTDAGFTVAAVERV